MYLSFQNYCEQTTIKNYTKVNSKLPRLGSSKPLLITISMLGLSKPTENLYNHCLNLTKQAQLRAAADRLGHLSSIDVRT